MSDIEPITENDCLVAASTVCNRFCIDVTESEHARLAILIWRWVNDVCKRSPDMKNTSGLTEEPKESSSSVASLQEEVEQLRKVLVESKQWMLDEHKFPPHLLLEAIGAALKGDKQER